MFTDPHGLRYVEARICHVDRLTDSAAGTPRFLVHTDLGSYRTQDDGAVNFEVSEETQDRDVQLIFDTEDQPHDDEPRLVGVDFV